MLMSNRAYYVEIYHNISSRSCKSVIERAAQTTPTSSFRPLTGGGEQRSLQPLRSPERRSSASDWTSAVGAVPEAGLPRCGNVSTSTRGFSLESRYGRAGFAEPVFRLSPGGGPTRLGPDPAWGRSGSPPSRSVLLASLP
ncbi:hypothetical protein LEMLEM_LOCUS21637 [Lemmus lemmus]